MERISQVYILVGLLVPMMVFWRSKKVEGVKTIRERLATLGYTKEEDFESYQGMEAEPERERTDTMDEIFRFEE